VGNAQALDDENFDKEVISSEIPVLVDFWADWCGPCKMIAPIIDEIAEEYSGKLKVGKVNVSLDNCKGTAERYGVMSIPTLILFKDGDVAEKLVGAVPKAKLKSFVEKNI